MNLNVICKMATILSRPQFVFVFVFDGLYLYLYLIWFLPVYFVFVFEILKKMHVIRQTLDIPAFQHYVYTALYFKNISCNKKLHNQPRPI